MPSFNRIKGYQKADAQKLCQLGAEGFLFQLVVLDDFFLLRSHPVFIRRFDPAFFGHQLTQFFGSEDQRKRVETTTYPVTVFHEGSVEEVIGLFLVDARFQRLSDFIVVQHPEILDDLRVLMGTPLDLLHEDRTVSFFVAIFDTVFGDVAIDLGHDNNS